MNMRQLLTERIYNQQLVGSGCSTPEDLVASLCAVQAQDYAAAKWALGLRIPGITDADIDTAYNDGRILRTHLMRPTWHFVVPEDIRWLLQLTAPRVNSFNAYMYRKMGLDDAIFSKSGKLITKALKGKNYLARTELEVILAKAGIATDEERMTCLMMHAELDGIICSGPRVGKQFSYALIDERVPAVKEITRDEALARLALRYFSSRGPATLQDYAWWCGLSTVDCKAALSMIRSKLQHEVIDGQEYWFVERDTPKTKLATFLLPNFDEYSVAYKDRSMLCDKTKLKRTLTPFELLGNLVIADGQVYGTWKRTIKKDALMLTLNYLQPAPAAVQKKVAQAAEQYRAFLQVSLVTIA